MRQSPNRRRHPRSGFTLLEVLVVIAIFAMLATLIFPAIQNARRAATKVQCLNNIRQVAMALHQANDKLGHLPNSGTYALNGDDLDGDGKPDNPGGVPSPHSTFWLQWAPWANPTFLELRPMHSWVLEVLPYLERDDIVDAWDFGKPFHDDKFSRNADLADTSIAVLACPADDSLVRGSGNLSYVVNGGFGRGWNLPIDWNGNGITKDFLGNGPTHEDTRDQRQSQFLGLMWQGNRNSLSRFDFRHRFSGVRDGLSTTVLLAENVRTGYDSSSADGVAHNWASPHANRVAFHVSAAVCQAGCSEEKPPDWALANGTATGEAINSSLYGEEGKAPWPSSWHGDGVHFAFCDGSARFVSDRVSGMVYTQLVSPAGGFLPYPSHRHLPIDESNY